MDEQDPLFIVWTDEDGWNAYEKQALAEEAFEDSLKEVHEAAHADGEWPPEAESGPDLYVAYPLRLHRLVPLRDDLSSRAHDAFKSVISEFGSPVDALRAEVAALRTEVATLLAAGKVSADDMITVCMGACGAILSTDEDGCCAECGNDTARVLGMGSSEAVLEAFEARERRSGLTPPAKTTAP